MSDFLKFFVDVPITSPDLSVLNAMLRKYFRYKNFKNTTQRNVISEILKRDSDIIVSLPKGSGRTMCFQLPISISTKKVSIVFVALTSRIKVQIARLKKRNNYVEFLNSKTTADDWSRILNNIHTCCNMLSSKNTVLYMTPEVVSTVHFLNLMQLLVKNNQLGYIVVDEAYHESYWLLGDAKEYNGLRNLRNRLPNVPWIITTANGSAEVVNHIRTILCLQTQRSGLPKDSIPCYGFFEDDVCLDR
ncbi:ATP-dependent DNA helicase Q5-like [Aphis gossypii]|uniref:ATP-dependent DNA helicase Q5-like n=1 Tax=Aphis gossypii TaxID=80765 RepID=UPI0021593D9F|nr:ATP-dependent DNA helicase Q5-like [Aphis gossypii]